MTLIKFKPGTTRELLRDSMMSSHAMSAFDSFFNDHAGKFERNVFFTPRTDVVESDKTFTVSVVLPGLKKDEIKIEVDGDKLTISGERKQTVENKDVKLHMVESFYGKFSRSFNLPENVDKQSIQAELTDGILHLSIPKVEVTETKTSISIK
jgi:HSP20 family protein